MCLIRDHTQDHTQDDNVALIPEREKQKRGKDNANYQVIVRLESNQEAVGETRKPGDQTPGCQLDVEAISAYIELTF